MLEQGDDLALVFPRLVDAKVPEDDFTHCPERENDGADDGDKKQKDVDGFRHDTFQVRTWNSEMIIG